MTLIYKGEKVPPVVEQVLRDKGWLEWDSEHNQAEEWNLNWKPTR